MFIKAELYTGLSSVMIMKLPKDMGPEIVRPDQPMNGQLQITGKCFNGQFVTADYSPKMKIGDFYVFPYDMQTLSFILSPIKKQNEERWSVIVDVEYNPIKFKDGSMILRT